MWLKTIFVALLSVVTGVYLFTPYLDFNPAAGLKGYEGSVVGLLQKGKKVHETYKMELDRYTHELYRTKENYRPLQNLTFIVTGATSGLGKGIAGHLLALGAKVVVPSRRVHQLNRAELVSYSYEINDEYGDENRKKALSRNTVQKAKDVGNVVFVEMDLADIKSIKNCVETIKEKVQYVDGVVNNAGVFDAKGGKSKQGIDMSLAVNAVGSAVFTELLISRGVLNRAVHQKFQIFDYVPRVVSITSTEFRTSMPIDTSKDIYSQPAVEWASLFTSFRRYAFSKLVQTIYFTSLQNRFPLNERELIVFDVCPGAVGSNIAKNAGAGIPVLEWIGERVSWAMQHEIGGILQPKEAALPVVRLLTYLEMEKYGGSHFHRSARESVREDMEREDEITWVQNQINDLLFRYT